MITFILDGIGEGGEGEGPLLCIYVYLSIHFILSYNSLDMLQCEDITSIRKISFRHLES